MTCTDFGWVTEINMKWFYWQGYYKHLMLDSYENRGDMLYVKLVKHKWK